MLKGGIFLRPPPWTTQGEGDKIQGGEETAPPEKAQGGCPLFPPLYPILYVDDDLTNNVSKNATLSVAT